MGRKTFETIKGKHFRGRNGEKERQRKGGRKKMEIRRKKVNMEYKRKIGSKKGEKYPYDCKQMQGGIDFSL